MCKHKNDSSRHGLLTRLKEEKCDQNRTEVSMGEMENIFHDSLTNTNNTDV